MDLLPAIDLLDGHCVRLLHGDFAACKVYSRDPAALARDYRAAGAGWLHVVDLAASRDGEAADPGPLFRLLGEAPQAVQTGGGVRSGADIQARLDAGAARVVVGSLCVTDTARFTRWLRRFGSDQLVAALDVRIDGSGVPWPRIYGWTQKGGIDLWRLMEGLSGAGLRHALVTDIGRDGALSGPNLALYRNIRQRWPELALQASGGVSSLDDLRGLAATGASAAITGKALLEGRFTVAQALACIVHQGGPDD